jgi:Transposase family tnp2
MVSNSPYTRKMQYRASHQHDPTKVTDILDDAHYSLLQESFVTVGGEELPNWFFSDPRDIALGLSTDGFGPFKHRTKTAWPIILFNYNLPPEERFLKKNIIPIGVIPGPKKPGDLDSFLWPLVQELLQLELGVSAFDAIKTTVFLLHAYLIVVFGDIPAVSMIMCMKGHNGRSPCRMCEIQGIRIPSSQVTMHYVPLHHENFPDSQHRYDATMLPLQNHASFMEQAQEVQSALTNAASDQLATKYGVKGLPLLSALSSLSFPVSFPYDFMHLIWTNLIPNLILLWTGNFKDLDHDDEGYVLVPKVWQAIGAATLDAGKTIPAVFGSRVPNIAAEKSQMIAETHSIWMLYLAPTLLNGRFINEQYYKHFVQLVRLLTLCLKFEITQDQINDLERGYQEWVEEYEWYKLLSLPDAI